MTRRVGLDHPTPPAPVRGRTLITVAAGIIAAFLLIVTCTTVDTAKAAPTGGTVYYVDVLRCDQSGRSIQTTNLGKALGNYSTALLIQDRNDGVTAQVRMRKGKAGSPLSHLVYRSLKACA